MNEYQKPYTFRAGSYAKSSEVNTNFDSIKDYVNELREYAEDILISSAPYNKADINGNEFQPFKVLAATQANEAVNLGQLQTVEGDLNTVAGKVTNIENAGYIAAPTYTNGGNIPANTTITRNGVLVIKAYGSSNPSIVIDGTTFTLAPNQIFSLPVKNGTVIGSKTNIDFSKLYS